MPFSAVQLCPTWAHPLYFRGRTPQGPRGSAIQLSGTTLSQRVGGAGSDGGHTRTRHDHRIHPPLTLHRLDCTNGWRSNPRRDLKRGCFFPPVVATAGSFVLRVGQWDRLGRLKVQKDILWNTFIGRGKAHGSRLNLDRATREKVRVRTQGLQPPSKPKWLRCATCMPDEALPTQGDLGDAHTCTEAAS